VCYIRKLDAISIKINLLITVTYRQTKQNIRMAYGIRETLDLINSMR